MSRENQLLAPFFFGKIAQCASLRPVTHLKIIIFFFKKIYDRDLSMLSASFRKLKIRPSHVVNATVACRLSKSEGTKDCFRDGQYQQTRYSLSIINSKSHRGDA